MSNNLDELLRWLDILIVISRNLVLIIGLFVVASGSASVYSLATGNVAGGIAAAFSAALGAHLLWKIHARRKTGYVRKPTRKREQYLSFGKTVEA